MDACLSPNGQSVYAGETPPTRLFVATAQGVSSLERAAPDAPWQLRDTALDTHHVSTMTLVPGQPGIFAGTHDDGIYFSADGAHWEKRDSGVTHRDIYTLAAATVAGRLTLYAGTEPASLFRSVDLGKSWVELPAIHQVPDTERWIFPGPPHIAHTKMLAFHPRDPHTIFAAIEQGALLKTTDGGQSWHELSSYSRADDRAYKDVHQLLIVPARPEIMFMTTGIGLYRSDDGGTSWERLTGSEFRISYPDHMALSPDEKTLFMSGAASNPGAWRRSHDAGTAIVRSRDGGRSWEHLHRGIPGSAPCNIEAMSLVRHAAGFSLFVGNTDGEVYQSDDEGDNWQRIVDALAPVSKGDHFRPLSEAARAGLGAR